MRNARGVTTEVTLDFILGLSDVRQGFYDRARGLPMPPFTSREYEFGRQLHAFGHGYTPGAVKALIQQNPIWSRT